MSSEQQSPATPKQQWPKQWSGRQQVNLTERLAFLGITGDEAVIAIANDLERHKATVDDLERYITFSRSLSSSIARIQEQRTRVFTPVGRFYTAMKAQRDAGWAEVIGKYFLVAGTAIPLWIVCAPIRLYFALRVAYYKSKHHEWFGQWMAVQRRGY